MKRAAVKKLDPWSLPLGGTKVIEASAGTGKTHTLTTLYLRMLVEQDLTPADILVVTYTNAAAAELRDRVRSRIQRAIALAEGTEDAHDEAELRDFAVKSRAESAAGGRVDPLRRALQEFDEAAIFTIHGFCQRTLQENAFESGVAFGAELVERSEVLQQTLANDLWARILEGEDPGLVEWLLNGVGSRSEFKPDALRAFILDNLGADDEMPVLPDAALETEGEDFAALAADVEAAWLSWSGAWRARREPVSALLLGENDLNKRGYNAGAIESTWLPQLEDWSADIERVGPAEAMNAVGFPSWWERLTPQGLSDRTKKNGSTPEDPFFDACGEVARRIEVLESARRARVLWLRRRFVDEAREEARKRREQKHLLFFDDLLTELRAALRPPGGDRLRSLLRDRYRFALIDEFQDTDPVQYEIFRRVWHVEDAEEPGRGLVLIGDPKQAIYSFRGADVFTYLRAAEDARDDSHGLATNWRSNASLIAAVNALFERPEHPFGLESIGFHPVEPREGADRSFAIPGRSGAGLRVLMADRKAARAHAGETGEIEETKPLELRLGRTDFMDALARDVADLLDSGAMIGDRPIAPSDVAVLCRKNAELVRARRALEAIGIPCVDRGDANVFESREAWELASVLRAMLRSADPASLRAALSSGAHGLDAHEIEALDDQDPNLVAAGERFAEYGRIWSQFGFGRAFSIWRRQEKVKQRLLGFEDGERRLTNWLHLGELLQRIEEDRATSRAGLVAWLENAIESKEARLEVGSETSLLRLERDDEAVSLVTLHRSKGLEYEVVYLPSLWEEGSVRTISEESAKDESKRRRPVRYFDEKTGRRTLDLGGPDYAEHVGLSKGEEFSEQMRLLYVGLTRARQQCVVLWGAIGTAYTKTALAWLLHAPAWQAEGKDRSTSSKELKDWTDEQWLGAWQAFAEAAGDGAVSIETARLGRRERWNPPTPDSAPLAFSAPERSTGRPILTTSFSGLVREARREAEPLLGPSVTGRDLDSEVQDDRFEGADEAAPDLAAAMHEFPRGAEAGTLLHDVLERIDFARLDASDSRRLAAEAVDRNGFDPRHIDQIVHVVDAVAHTPLRTEPDMLRLADIESGQQRPEIEFTLAAGPRSDMDGFSPSSLAGLLATAPEDSPLRRYAERAGRLGWRTLKGYLRGFIDSVFFDGSRYFLIDYKSNHLGSRQADYLPEELVGPMLDHDYVLQYLIYTVALDRHLETRMAGYDYDEHFGGVYYLFLRGLAPSHPTGCGVFFDKPSAGLVRGLSELIGRPGVSEGGP